jgi:outer membrane protein
MRSAKTLMFFLLVILGQSLCAAESTKSTTAVVNFGTCVQESKYGKHEQEQFMNVRKQWDSLIEETEKELKNLASKFEDQEYMDGLSPEAEQELKIKYKTLNEDLAKYQGQLYQIMNQANMLFYQKLSSVVAKAAEKIATDRKLGLVLNKEICFYHEPSMDITPLVINEMDKNFESEMKTKNDGEKGASPQMMAPPKASSPKAAPKK